MTKAAQREQSVRIRPFAAADAREVRELFIAVNRLLAPPDRREAFEAYIARALAEEMDRITDYYAEHDGGFWGAIAEDAWLGSLASNALPGSDGASPHVCYTLRRRGIAPPHASGCGGGMPLARFPPP